MPEDRRNAKSLLVALAMHGVHLREDPYFWRGGKTTRHWHNRGSKCAVNIVLLKNGRFKAHTYAVGGLTRVHPERSTLRQALVDVVNRIEND